jgi:hypothetical protein
LAQGGCETFSTWGGDKSNSTVSRRHRERKELKN